MDYLKMEKMNTLNTYDVFMNLIWFKICLAKSKRLDIESIVIHPKAYDFILKYNRERKVGFAVAGKYYTVFGEKVIRSLDIGINEVKTIISI